MSLKLVELRQKLTTNLTIDELKERTELSPVRCADPDVEQEMMDAIDNAKKNGDSIGGVVEVIASGMPAGVGSYVQYDRKLDAKACSSNY